MSCLRTTLSRRARCGRRGATTTELALVLPIILLLILGMVDFALVMYAYGTVSEAARTGARYAIVHGSAAGTPVGPTANNATVAGVVKANVPALDTSQVTVASSWGNGNNDPGSPVTVTVTYNCSLTAGKMIGCNSVTVSGTTTMLITH
jgi:Flp pilus assembly protein TadG